VTGDISGEEKSSKTIQVRWVRSAIGFSDQQKRRVQSLGLRRLQQVVELPDTPSVRGLVARVAHLVQIAPPSRRPRWASVPEYSIRAPEVTTENTASAPSSEADHLEEPPVVLAGQEQSTSGAMRDILEHESEIPLDNGESGE
jgi:large subunit ribosomal protein L30